MVHDKMVLSAIECKYKQRLERMSHKSGFVLRRRNLSDIGAIRSEKIANAVIREMVYSGRTKKQVAMWAFKKYVDVRQWKQIKDMDRFPLTCRWIWKKRQKSSNLMNFVYVRHLSAWNTSDSFLKSDRNNKITKECAFYTGVISCTDIGMSASYSSVSKYFRAYNSKSIYAARAKSPLRVLGTKWGNPAFRENRHHWTTVDAALDDSNTSVKGTFGFKVR